METWFIHLNGQMQGVGCPPFVHHPAKDMPLNGWVKNGSDGVHTEINASARETDLFCKSMHEEIGMDEFLIMKDAANLDTISQLSRRKMRPKKPFALMFSDLATAEYLACMSIPLSGPHKVNQTSGIVGARVINMLIYEQLPRICQG